MCSKPPLPNAAALSSPERCAVRSGRQSPTMQSTASTRVEVKSSSSQALVIRAGRWEGGWRERERRTWNTDAVSTGAELSLELNCNVFCSFYPCWHSPDKSRVILDRNWNAEFLWVPILSLGCMCMSAAKLFNQVGPERSRLHSACCEWVLLTAREGGTDPGLPGQDPSLPSD